MKRTFTRFFFLLLLVIAGVNMPVSTHAQVKQSGKNFWLTLSGNSSDTAYIMLSSRYHAAVTFNYNTTATATHYNVQPGEVLQIVLTPTELASFNVVHPAGAISNKSLNIQSDSSITVYFSTTMHSSEDGMLIYPTDKQQFGDTYYLCGTPMMGAVGGFGINLFSIVATCDSTVIEITPSQIIAGNYQQPARPAGIPYTIVLNKGQTYQLGPGLNLKHITGTKLRIISAKCCNPLNVFLTYPPTYMSWDPMGGNGACCGDEMLEQLLPISEWDTLFPILSFHNNPYNKINIVSAFDNNVISMDGVPFRTLMSGEFYDTIITKPVVIRSSQPAAVTEYMIAESECIITYIGTPTNNIPADSLSDPDALVCLSFKNGVREAYLKSIGKAMVWWGRRYYIIDCFC